MRNSNVRDNPRFAAFRAAALCLIVQMSSTGDHILWLSSSTTPNLHHQANGGTVSITSSVAIVNDTTWSMLVGT